MKITRTLGLGVVLGAGLAGPAAADMAQTHDGLYLRLHLGFGYSDMTADSTPDVSVSGSSRAFGFSIGGMVMENFGVFGEISNSFVASPEVKYGSIKASLEDVTVGVIGFGAGVIYYFMPVNLYVSFALLGDRLSFVADGDKVAETDKGLGLNLMVGKEWWVSDNWGLGVAAALRYSRINEKDGEPTWSVMSGNLAFSATFN